MKRTWVKPEPDKSKGPSAWERNATHRALDQLFSSAMRYRSSAEFIELLTFIRAFRSYAPYNAMLLHIQMPGAVYVAPAKRWLCEYNRRVKPTGRPLVILQPMGPVMFVFDVSDTEPLDEKSTLPRAVEAPFEAIADSARAEFEWTIRNALRDGVRVSETKEGSQSAGSISRAKRGLSMDWVRREKPTLEVVTLPIRYELVLNEIGSEATRYSTLLHELAHLYCGHLGTPDESWWPDRQHLSTAVEEFEAESISWLVCHRMGIATTSDQYLSAYAERNVDIPDISIELVMKVAGLLEQMGRSRMPLREPKKLRTRRQAAPNTARNA